MNGALCVGTLGANKTNMRPLIISAIQQRDYNPLTKHSISPLLKDVCLGFINSELRSFFLKTKTQSTSV